MNSEPGQSVGTLHGWTTLEQSIRVDAPMWCVELLLIDFRTLFPSLENVIFDDTFPEVGGTLTYTMRLGVLAVMEVSLTMLEWKRGFILGDLAIHAMKLKTGGLVAHRHSTSGSVMWHLMPSDEGTLVTGRYQYQQPSEYFEQILEQRVARNLISQSLTQTLHTIKRMAENRLRE